MATSKQQQPLTSPSPQLEAKMAIFQDPQCLIETDESGTLRARQDVLAELQKLDKPLVVVAITGLYRTGKSYLMNRLAGGSNGFALGSTVESKTKGIWIWVREHPVKKDTYLVLLDTEGLGDAVKGDPDHDTWIFTLAILLSNTFVYNFTGAISEDMFSKLQFISEISNKIKVHRVDAVGESSDFDMYFPELIFTARDFGLDLVIKGKEVSPSEYLEHMLTLKDNQCEGSQEARRCIRKYFLKRRCFVFDRPGGRDTVNNLEHLKEKELAKSFVQDTNIFTDYIWKQCPTLSLPNGQPLNGPMFSTRVEMYVQAIQQGGVPCMESAYTMMARRENEKLIVEVLDMCRRHITESGVVPTETEEELVELLGKMQQEAVDAFVPRAVFDADETHTRTFMEKLQEVRSETEEENRAHSRRRCEEALLGLSQPVKEKHTRGVYMKPGGYELYKRDMEQLEQEYVHRKLGVLKMQVLAEFYEQEDRITKTILAADERLTEAEKQREETKTTLALKANQLMKQEEDIHQLEEHHKQQTQIHEETARRIKEKMQTEISLQEKKMEELDEKRKEEHRRLKEEGQKMVEELKTQAEASKQRQQRELEITKKMLDQENKMFLDKSQSDHEATMSAVREQLQGTQEQLESDVTAVVRDLQGRHTHELSEMEKQLAAIKVQHDNEMKLDDGSKGQTRMLEMMEMMSRMQKELEELKRQHYTQMLTLQEDIRGAMKGRKVWGRGLVSMFLCGVKTIFELLIIMIPL